MWLVRKHTVINDTRLSHDPTRPIARQVEKHVLIALCGRLVQRCAVRLEDAGEEGLSLKGVAPEQLCLRVHIVVNAARRQISILRQTGARFLRARARDKSERGDGDKTSSICRIASDAEWADRAQLDVSSRQTTRNRELLENRARRGRGYGQQLRRRHVKWHRERTAYQDGFE